MLVLASWASDLPSNKAPGELPSWDVCVLEKAYHVLSYHIHYMAVVVSSIR